MGATSSVWTRLFARQYWSRWAALIFWLSILVLYEWYTYGATPMEVMQNVLDIMRQPVVGPLLYILFYTVQPLIWFPTWLLTVAAGLVYGAWWGVIYTMIAANCSAIFTYLIGRYFATGLLDPNQAQGVLQRYATHLRENTFEAVLLLRFLFLPYDLLSYAAGILHLRWQPFLLATIIGSIPGTLAFVLFGTSFQGDFTQAAPSIDWRMLALSVVMFAASFGLSRLFKRKV